MIIFIEIVTLNGIIRFARIFANKDGELSDWNVSWCEITESFRNKRNNIFNGKFTRHLCTFFTTQLNLWQIALET